MLQDTYNLYLNLAENISDWRNIDKNELINKYIELETSDPTLANFYMAAIICRYWPKIYRFYKATPLVCTLEDVYDWLTESIIQTLNHKVWLDPNHKLYGDPKAPDKCINIRMKSCRLNHLVAANRDKRKLNINNCSLEELQENSGDLVNFNIEEVHTNEFEYIDYVSLMQFFYNQQLYFILFVYDYIYHNATFSIKNCALHLSKLTEDYLYTLASQTQLQYSDILLAYSFSVLGKPISRLHSNINQALIKLHQLYNEGHI